ncbi:hypothetical protein CO048_00275 [Candidatus Roizmanbacteria bacterium CG_4_9_14_0_2_um_filter_35_15]|uniref:Uncharacterized protein n=1 Tax=Candidatus Roizmanbacteria bacterium CG_4_9_14_0_2_um_filter_35_15 TaxID=1974836 RepID=A0A2M8F4Z8_9BACT|nr:MAG: hypothetical protein CO048_00275 [Candidatus Roizmanbacteria bacterium CG_4_9_14_0_2_um_filter_35_15]
MKKESIKSAGGRGGTSTLTYTGSTGGNVVPSVTLRRQGTGGNVIPTLIPTAVEQNLPPVEPTPTKPKLNFFQRIFNFLFGR